MQLVITIRKEVADRDEGELVFLMVKAKLADRPDVEINGHVTNHFVIDEEPS